MNSHRHYQMNPRNGHTLATEGAAGAGEFFARSTVILFSMQRSVFADRVPSQEIEHRRWVVT